MTPEQWKMISANLSNVFYAIIGVLFLLLGIRAFCRNKGFKRYTTLGFWGILFITFTFGPYMESWITGLFIIVLAVLSLINGVIPTTHKPLVPEETRRNADRIGYKIFIPALVLGLSTFACAQIFPKLGANNALGISGIIGLITAILVTKCKPVEILDDGLRLLDNVGTAGILPQLLAALGSVFTVAGVGAVIAGLVSGIIPEGARLLAVIVYCVGMALFTIIMGNGFAAFSVITVGIGIPFLINQGANPIVVGALGLTAGYCGTLLTPMAANFNIVPATLLEMKDKYGVIKAQAPVALVMLVVHILLMYFFAF